MADITYFKIGTTDFSRCVQYKVGYKKLWASDSGRNMAGVNKGTLVGIFTKLELVLGTMTASEMQSFLNATNVSSANVTYYDPQTNALKTESFYFGDVDVDVTRLKKNGTAYTSKYGQQSISVIANNPRT